MQFELENKKESIIKVIGVGGGGGNAVNHMYRQGIQGVDFVICNTDAQALEASPIPLKYQLGLDITEGLGAGAEPEVGKKAALESIEDIKDMLAKNTKMAFITAGMGGGTGTGAAPIIAEVAREMGILTVGIVTTPFRFEGRRRRSKAEEGIERLKDSVDSLLVINNERLVDIFGNLKLSIAFEHADNILATAAKSIAEIITYEGYVNVDFQDVKTVMQNSGVALMGTATAEGDDRATKAVLSAMTSPLLSENNIRGAKNILLNITSGSREILMDEISTITDHIIDEAGEDADMIWGNAYDEALGDKISVTIIATAFEGTSAQTEARHEQQQSQPAQNNAQQLHIPVDAPAEPVRPIAKPKPRNSSNMEDAFMSEADDQDSETRQILDLELDQEDGGSFENVSFNPNGPEKSLETDLHQLEREPAYIRRKKKLEQIKHSSDQNISRFTLSESFGKNRPEISENNAFLHDNVD